MRYGALTAILFLSLVPAYAGPKGVPALERAGDWDVARFASGTVVKAYAPAAPSAGKRALVVAFHGRGGNAADLLQFVRELADRRGDVWCVIEGGRALGEGRLDYDADQALAAVPEVTRWAVGRYGADPKRVASFGFSLGGTLAWKACVKNADLFVGYVSTAATEVPTGGREAAVKRLRGCFFLGDRDPNFSLAEDARRALKRYAPNFTFRVVRGLGHEPPHAAHLDDGFEVLFDRGGKGDERTLSNDPG